MRFKNLVLSKYQIFSDFKTVEKKFLDQGAKPEDVKTALTYFSNLRNMQRLPLANRNIDDWGKKPFKEFETYVMNLWDSSSKTSVKKDPHKKHNIEGAKFITENEDWVVYQIETFKGSELLGSRNWCTVRKEEEYNGYTKRNTLYYLLSKNKEPSDKWYKICLAVDFKGGTYFWDNQNQQQLKLPDLNIPDFKMEYMGSYKPMTASI